jgi:hypothetical protein
MGTSFPSTKVDDLLVPRKHVALRLQPASISSQTHDGTTTALLPVSATTSKHCGGVPTHSFTVKYEASFFIGAQCGCAAAFFLWVTRRDCTKEMGTSPDWTPSHFGSGDLPLDIAETAHTK